MADNERMDIISSAIAGLLKRHEEFDQRLARIERALELAPSARESAGPPKAEPRAAPQREALSAVPEPPQSDPPAWTPMPDVTAEPSSNPPQNSESDSSRSGEALETEMGLRWVNRIGAFTLVLAVGFFFKLAVENQWIGPAGRVILGVLAGFATIAAADVLWRRGHVIYAHGVSGMGIAILYLSFYASFGFYQLVPQAAAFLLMVSCTAMGCVLALRYDASAIALLGLLGGYATPVLLSTGIDRPWVFFSYLLLLNSGALILDKSRGWRRLSVLALVATVVLSFAWGNEHFLREKRLVATVYDLAFYALFVMVPSVWFVVISQAVATVTLSIILARDLVPFSVLLLAISTGGLALSERRNSSAVVQVTVAASWLAYAAFYAELVDPIPTGALLTLASALFLLFFLWTPWRVFYRDLPVRPTEMVAVAANAAAYFVAGYLLLEAHFEAYLGLFAVLVAVPHLGLGIAIWRGQGGSERVRNAVLMYLAVALTLLTLAVPIQFTGLRITMAWMLEAAALVWIGRRSNTERFVHAAAVVFLLGYLRLFTVDAWIYSDRESYWLVWNGRFLTFVVSSVCLWLAAWWTRPQPIAALPYIAGHIALFWILTQEVLVWALRVSGAEPAWNVQSAALSILWALYAVVLVASGVAWRVALNRRMGLLLLAVVVAKLYLNDIWQLRLAYRVTAFAALGALLLLTSFLYSRYRNSIGNWWRNERPES